MAYGSALVFNELRLRDELCDAILRVQDEDFHIHRIILSGCSEYFRSLFTRWSHPEDQVYEIDHVSPDIMRLIIEFAYIGSEEVSQQNVEELYIACDFFKITDLAEACCRYMGEHLSKNNCIDIWLLTETFFSPTLNHDVLRFIKQHFTEICASSEFLKLSLHQLLKLIEADQLLVRDEIVVFEAVLRWIDYLPEERTSSLVQILPKVRLALMTPESFMAYVRNNKMLMYETKCQSTVKTADTSPSDDIVCPPSVYYHPPPRTHLPTTVVLALGGQIKTGLAAPTNATETNDICTDHWLNVTTEEAPYFQRGAIFLKGSLYCVGGHNELQFSSSVRSFNLASHTWHQVTPVKMRRCCVTALDGLIYVIGGCDRHNCHSKAKCYYPDTNLWMNISSVQEHRAHASCTTFQGNVYIWGDFSGETLLSPAECYNADWNQWIASMNTDRLTGLGVAFDERIFLVGGNSEHTLMDSTEVYNTQANCWQSGTPVLSSYEGFGGGMVDGCLFASGGYNGFNFNTNVESYSLNDAEWSETTSMGISHSDLSCPVVSGLTPMADYAAPWDSLLNFPVQYANLSVRSLALGDAACGVANVFEAYDTNTDPLLTFCFDEDTHRAHHHTVSLHSCAYCVGGDSEAEAFRGLW